MTISTNDELDQYFWDVAVADYRIAETEMPFDQDAVIAEFKRIQESHGR